MTDSGPDRPIDYSAVAGEDPAEAVREEAAAVDDGSPEGAVLHDPSHEQDAQNPAD